MGTSSGADNNKAQLIVCQAPNSRASRAFGVTEADCGDRRQQQQVGAVRRAAGAESAKADDCRATDQGRQPIMRPRPFAGQQKANNAVASGASPT
ncbi:hypothetical protein, partial [Methylomonas koyamae]|uniref:hypothetical protein n=1 Tax=Methylomonas koyamae TaxID=702114 RepID=UPI00210F6544